jgi:hypothetical protein
VAARWGLSLVVIAAALRFGLFLVALQNAPNRPVAQPDTVRYVILAHNLRDHATFGKVHDDGLVHEALERIRKANGTSATPDANGLRPESYRVPGYPAFLAAVFTVWDEPHLAVVMQCLLGCLATWMVPRICLKLGIGPRGAWIAGLLWAVHPALIIYDQYLLTESLFTNLAVVALYWAAQGESPRASAGVGLLIGFTALVRPMVGLFYVPAALALGWGTRRHRWMSRVLLVGAAMLPCLAWSTRNYGQGEGFRVTTQAGSGTLFLNAAYTVSQDHGEDWLASWPTRIAEFEKLLAARVKPGEDVSSAAEQLGWEIIRQRPAAAFKAFLLSLIKVFIDHSLGELVAHFGVEYHPTGLFSSLLAGADRASGSVNYFNLAAAAVWSLANVAIVALALVGFVRLLRQRNWRAVLACGLTIGLFALATGCVGLERFRLPIMLFLFVGVAAAVTRQPASRPAGQPAAPRDVLADAETVAC